MSEFQSLPKIELHLHLDTSLSFEVVKKLAPGTSYQTYVQDFVAPSKCEDLLDYISRAQAAIDLMQTPEQLRLVTLDLFEQLEADNIRYVEIRFAPLQHTQEGLNPEQVVTAVLQAMEEASDKTGVEGRLILCTLRHYSEQQSMETVQLVEQFSDQNVCGFDLAADEARYPIDAHVKAFEYAHRHQLNATAHAGEAVGPQSVWETLTSFHVKRLGHGVRSVEDPELLEYLSEKNIHLEVCPTSNIQTDVFDQLENHSLPVLIDHGISVGINTDGRGLSNVSLSDEYETLHHTFGWNKDDFYTANLEAVNHAFCDEQLKHHLRVQLKEAYNIDHA